jgi:RNA polymerase sigma-70 factor (ECF subfamily)
VNPASRQHFIAAVERAHTKELRRFLLRKLGKGTLSEIPDLLQEIFLRLLRVKDHEAIRNPQAYLITIAGHVIHQHLLQEDGKPESIDPLRHADEDSATMADDADSAPDPADELEIAERLERVRRELTKVSPRAYATLMMYRCEGMTLTEIGERLGVSHVMVRKYLSRAITYCDQRLRDIEE